MTDRISSNPNVCYCGAYGGGVHTKSARCVTTALDVAWRTFLMNSASDRDPWEAFVAGWHAGHAEKPTGPVSGPVGWQPIATAPLGGKWVQVWWPQITDCALPAYQVDGEWRSPIGLGYEEGDLFGKPTLWQPLPEPPQGGSEKAGARPCGDGCLGCDYCHSPSDSPPEKL